VIPLKILRQSNHTVFPSNNTCTAWLLRRTWLLTVILVIICTNILSGINSRGYYPDDWISYTKTRFVRSISIGFYNVYFGTSRGVLRYDTNRNEWLDPLTKSDGLEDQNIERIAADPDDSRIWVQTPSGIYMYETIFDEWSSVDLFPLEYYRNDINRINDFQKYIPPFGYHIMEPGVLQDSELRDYSIITAVESNWGDIWIGTWGMGMGKIEKYDISLTLMNFGLYSDACHTMYQDEDVFYFGGRNDYGAENALTVWNRQENDWKYIEARYDNRFTSDQVNDIIGAGDNIFLATDFGLVKMDRDGQEFRSYGSPSHLQTDNVLSLEQHKGRVYFGTDRGMYMLDVKSDSIQYMGGQLINNAAILDILYYKGDLWIGTDIGAVRYDFAAKKYYRYASDGGVLLGWMYDIEKDPDNGLWFAGDDAIIWMNDRFEEQERFYINGVLDGFTPNKIIVDRRYLWIGTDYGIYRYDRMKHYWKHLTEDDGIIDNQVFDLILDNDYLWIATLNGVTRYYWNNPIRGEDY
jgi:ligand-binding sensor domain-containing protein